MKGTLRFYSAAIIFLLTLCMLSRTSMAQAPPAAEQPLARVNGIAIDAQALEQEIGQLRAEMARRNMSLTDTQLSALRPRLVEGLIERELLYQQARLSKIKAQAKWVDAALADLKGQLDGAESLQAYLATSGMTMPQLKERLAKGVVVERLMRQETTRAILVSDAEMQSFYRNHPELFTASETIRARHILVAPRDATETAWAEALQEIKALQRRIEQGENFAVLALEYSDCPSRAYAGDIGYLTRDQMVTPFADAAFALVPGQVSDIVPTAFGYHLIKLLERIAADPPNFWEARDEIERTLRRDKENAAIRSYVAALKKQAVVERLGASN